MTLEQIKRLAFKYKQRLTEMGYTPVGYSSPPASHMAHLVWMCDEIESMKDQDKANRWLGFIHGVMWWADTYTIDEMRSHVRAASE